MGLGPGDDALWYHTEKKELLDSEQQLLSELEESSGVVREAPAPA